MQESKPISKSIRTDSVRLLEPTEVDRGNQEIPPGCGTAEGMSQAAGCLN